MPTKKLVFFFFKFLGSLLTAGIFTSVFKDNKSLRTCKTVNIKVFLNFSLLIEGSGSGSVQIITYRILEGKKLVDPDTDPEHCFDLLQKS
jgi:hypothetical protein